jgi:membrane protein implicated in regulation of membrane protease activity
MNVNCPHCGGGIENRPDIAGEVVSCPHCVRQLRLPAWQQVMIPEAQQVSQAGQQPVFIVNAPAKQRARLKPRGWFANSLGTAAGFFICAFLFLIAMCGGLYLFVGWNVASISSAARRIDAEGRTTAEKLIKPHGIVALSDRSDVSISGDDWTITGTGLDADNKTHDVVAEIEIARFGNTKRRELKSLMIDGARVYP